MIIKPIIPIWLMGILGILMIYYMIYSTYKKNKSNRKDKYYLINLLEKIIIIIILFVINLRFMIPNGENIQINSNLNVLFVIDTSVSMKALDYAGEKERFEGVINDCCNIVDELSGGKFSVITFGDTTKKLIPFTTDSDMVQAELKAIKTENNNYAKGTSLNIVKDTIEKTLEDEQKRKKENSKYIIFFISDGEITKENEKLESFKEIKSLVSNGAVMGYGTTTGGKMVNSSYEDNPSSDFYYLYYYDENYKKITGISKIDESNLKKIASDIGIDYIHMEKENDIKNKIKKIKEQQFISQNSEDKSYTYQDIYYYFSIPLVILLIVNFVIQKRRL